MLATQPGGTQKGDGQRFATVLPWEGECKLLNDHHINGLGIKNSVIRLCSRHGCVFRISDGEGLARDSCGLTRSQEDG